jgi:hypothetical protein
MVGVRGPCLGATAGYLEIDLTSCLHGFASSSPCIKNAASSPSLLGFASKRTKMPTVIISSPLFRTLFGSVSIYALAGHLAISRNAIFGVICAIRVVV